MHTDSVRTMITALLVAGMILGALPGDGRAQEPPPGWENDVSHVLDDGGTAEVGVEWITDWPGTGNDRANWYYSCNNLYGELLGAGWIGRFNWGETNAWEKDFKRMDLGGINNNMIDSVDLAMLCTHGTSGYDSFWNKSLSAASFTSYQHDTVLSPGEAYRAYGDTDVEWLAFDSCSVLRDDSMWYWHETFNGLHLMLGFANTMYVVYPGDGGEWGDQMRKKGWWIFGHGAKTVTQAWFSAVEDQQPSGVRARVLAEALDNYNDYIWGQGYVSADYPNNGSYWYWDHVAGTPEPLQLTAPPTSLPVYHVVPRTVNDDYVRNVGQAFGMTGTVLSSPDGTAFYMAGGFSDTKQLRVDALSGGYFFQDLNELWTKPEMTRTLPTSDRGARAVVSSFFGQQGEGLPGVWWFDPDILPTTQLEGPANGLGEQPGAALAATALTTPTNYALSYARTLDIGGGQRVSVVGPGSRQNVYIGDDSAIIGMKGGWREVQTQTAQSGLQATAAVTVPIKSAEEAWYAFVSNPTIALALPPQALTYTQKTTPTLAYYEQSLSTSQAELIPVWVFVADLYTQTATSGVQVQAVDAVTVATDVELYVPASADPAALPQATIIDPTPGTTVGQGQSLVLNGEASGGTPPYQYVWSSSADGLLGTGPTLTIPGLHPDLHGGQLQPNAIVLLVIDANGQLSTDKVDVTVLVDVYLPLVLRVQ